MRVLSHSEVSAMLDCEYRHAFAYTGHLTGGDTLSPVSVAPVLREGRAWGRAVAAWHSTGERHLAFGELGDALNEDAEDQTAAGCYLKAEHDEMRRHLQLLLAHYINRNEALGIDRLEQEVVVSIPSRGGKRRSTKYRLQAFFDGMVEDENGIWLVEFKLRKRRLSDLTLVSRSRQIHWYCWAWRELTGVSPVGVIHDETLNAVPSPVKLNKDGELSKVQSCTVEAYRMAGGDDDEVAARLAAKQWGRTDRIFLTEAELDTAGKQLVSAAQRVKGLDSGELFPIRNPSPARCPSCQFRDICDDPGNTDLVDSLFTRTTPKRERTIAPVIR